MEKMEGDNDVQDMQSRISSFAISSNPPASNIDKSNMVGLNVDMIEIKE